MDAADWGKSLPRTMGLGFSVYIFMPGMRLAIVRIKVLHALAVIAKACFEDYLKAMRRRIGGLFPVQVVKHGKV